MLILSCWKSQLLKYLNVLTSAAAKQNDVINKCRLRTCTYLNKTEAQLYQACSREVELEGSLGRRLGCPKRATKRQVWVGYWVSITINLVIVVSVSGQTPSKSFMKTKKVKETKQQILPSQRFFIVVYHSKSLQSSVLYFWLASTTADLIPHTFKSSTLRSESNPSTRSTPCI